MSQKWDWNIMFQGCNVILVLSFKNFASAAHWRNFTFYTFLFQKESTRAEKKKSKKRKWKKWFEAINILRYFVRWRLQNSKVLNVTSLHSTPALNSNYLLSLILSHFISDKFPGIMNCRTWKVEMVKKHIRATYSHSTSRIW